jgi:hypothetical protein
VGNGFMWCSPECRSTGRARIERERRVRTAKTRPPSNCTACGKPLTAQRSSRRFCSDACRQAAYRERKCAPSAARTNVLV